MRKAQPIQKAKATGWQSPSSMVHRRLPECESWLRRTGASSGRCRDRRAPFVTDLDAGHAGGELVEVGGIEVVAHALKAADQTVAQILKTLPPADVRPAIHEPVLVRRGRGSKVHAGARVFIERAIEARIRPPGGHGFIQAIMSGQFG